MDSTLIGYLLLGAIAASGALFVGFKVYHGERRTYLRRRRRERAAIARARRG